MLTGFASGCPTDAHEEMLLGFIPTYDLNNGMRGFLPIQPVKGCGNVFWAIGADEIVQKVVWCPEGSIQNISVVFDPLKATHSVFAEPNGTWSNAGATNFLAPTLALTALTGKNISGYFTTSSEIVDTYGDNGQLTNWNLSGLRRYSTVRPDSYRTTEAECDVTITTTGVHQKLVAVSLNGQILCSGLYNVLLGPGTVTLFAPNTISNRAANPVVAGTVDLDYSANITSGAFLTKRYAASYTVSMGGKAVTVPDDGLSEVLPFTFGPFLVGPYTMTVTPISDSGIMGTPLTKSVTVGGAPNPPTNLHYVSGDCTNTALQFTGSTTSGVAGNYNVYCPLEINGPTVIEAPNEDVIVSTILPYGSHPFNFTLPSYTAMAGSVTVFVTAVYGGVESLYAKLQIFYLADGTVALPIPNVPSVSFSTPIVTSGRTINVNYSYDPTNQAVVPTKLQTQIKDESGTITTQTAFSISVVNGQILTGTNQIATSADGWYSVQLRSESALGRDSGWSNWIGPIWVSNETIAAVTGLTVNVVG